MSALAGGWSIFVAALRSVLVRPVIALSLWLAAGTGFLAVELARSADFHAGGEGTVWGGVLIDVFLTAILAVAWHRVVLRPGQRDIRLRRWLHYGLAWIVNGLCFFLILFPIGLLVTIVLGAGADLVLYGGVYLDPGVLETLSVWSLNLMEPPGVFPAFLILGTLFLWLLYRLALGLPHIAVEDRDLRFRSSWDRSRPLARPIIGLAVIANVAQMPLMMIGYLLPYAPEGAGVWADLPTALVLSYSYAIVILVGAAILTELYRLTIPPAHVPPEDVAQANAA